jgi:transcriptional regulator with XRE-family HTH domain
MYSRYAQIRDEKGYKDADVARMAGLKQTVFSEWKSGKAVPKTDKLFKIAEALEVTMDYLMTGIKNTNTEVTFLEADTISKLYKDKKLREALDKYFTLPEEKRKLIIDLINAL